MSGFAVASRFGFTPTNVREVGMDLLGCESIFREDKLESFTSVLDGWISEEVSVGRVRLLSVAEIHRRLVSDGITGKCSIVREYAAKVRRRAFGWDGTVRTKIFVFLLVIRSWFGLTTAANRLGHKLIEGADCNGKYQKTNENACNSSNELKIFKKSVAIGKFFKFQQEFDSEISRFAVRIECSIKKMRAGNARNPTIFKKDEKKFILAIDIAIWPAYIPVKHM